MSYILKNTNPFVSVKMTENGRRLLASGNLNFSYWAIGDSEINYDREIIVDANQNDVTLSGASRVFRPFDRQPEIKSYITTNSGNNLNVLNASSINVVKATVNNSATERGFFSGDNLIYSTLTSSTYTIGVTSILNTTLTGGTTLLISTATTINVGDILRLKLTNDLTSVSAVENITPLPNLWYKVQSTGYTSGSSISVVVDRLLPNNSGQTSSNSYLFVYKGGEIANSFGYDTSTAYWDSGTLSFDSATNITCDDVKVWNMNNVWCENIAGITGLTSTNLYEDYTKFGSYDYLGTKNPYLEYLCTTNLVSLPINCNDLGYSYDDTISKSVSLIHYTNNTISNLYGEFLHIDTTTDKLVRITLPDLMYHRRGFTSGTGTTMGMVFESSGSTKLLGFTTIEYVDLYEQAALVGNKTPIAIGKVFPQLKMVVIEDDEIVAAISYKSNRNWTLPKLNAFLSAPTGGTNTGVLEVNKTMYLTYTLENSTTATGLTTSLPCQNYIKVTNNTSSSKDVSFKIADVDLLPYMRKVENVSYDGLGFYARKFKLLYQIVDTINDRPESGSWKTYDFTSTQITGTLNSTINPVLLENQSPMTNGFVLTNAINTGATIFDITQTLSMAPNTIPDKLQFGDERFFYGNLETYIGATIFKTLFDIRINSAEFNQTTNSTRSKNTITNPPNIKATEIAIYDKDKTLVIIGKLSTPVALLPANTIMIELSIDF